jgi:hypothetical protein
MHKLPIFLLSIVFFSFFGATQAYAVSIRPLDASGLFMLDSSKDPAVLAVEGDSVYLNVENIVVNTDGIFLSTNENILFQLSALFSNEIGVYTRVLETNPSLATVWPIIKCKNCGNHFAKTIFNKGECPVCGTIN